MAITGVPAGAVRSSADAAALAERIARVRASMGASASQALGADIPRPQPATYAPGPNQPDWRALRRLEEDRARRLLALQEEAEMASAMRGQGPSPAYAAQVQQLEDGTFAAVTPDGSTFSVEKLEGRNHFRFPDNTVREADGALVATADGTPVARGVASANLGEDELVRLAEDARQYWRSLNEPGESISPGGLRRLRARLEKLTPEDTQRLLEAMAPYRGGTPSPDDIQVAAGYLNDILGATEPDALAALPGQRIDDAVRAYTEPGQPRPRVDQPEGAGPGVPEPLRRAAFEAQKAEAAGQRSSMGWSEMAEAFNTLDPETQAEVLSRMPAESQKFLGQFISQGGEAAEISPNALARITDNSGEIESLFAELEAARLSGDPVAEWTARDLLMEHRQSHPEEMAEAIRRYAERRDAGEALQRALVERDEQFAAARAGAQRASLPEGQPSLPAPGARQPDVAPYDVIPPSERLPEVAGRMEAREAEGRRVQTGGSTIGDDQRAARIKNIRDAQGEVKRWMGENPLDTRGGTRRLDGFDEAAIAKANELNAAIASAQRELDAARSAAEAVDIDPAGFDALSKKERKKLIASLTDEEQAALSQWMAAKQRYDAAYSDLDRAFPSKSTDFPTSAPGRAPFKDSTLNRPSSQEAHNSLILTMVGGRQKAKRNLSRASDSMTPGEERRALRDIGAELDTDSEWDRNVLGRAPEGWAGVGVDVDAADAPLKPKRPSNPPSARARAALFRYFGGEKPFGTEAGKFYETAEEAARDMVSRTDVFEPGSASAEIAVQRVQRLLESEYRTDAEIQIAANRERTLDGDPVRPITSKDPRNIPREAGATNRRAFPEEQYGPTRDRSQPESPPLSEEDARLLEEAYTPEEMKALPADDVDNVDAMDPNLQASGTEITDPDAPPAKGKRGGRRSKKDPADADVEAGVDAALDELEGAIGSTIDEVVAKMVDGGSDVAPQLLESAQSRAADATELRRILADDLRAAHADAAPDMPFEDFLRRIVDDPRQFDNAVRGDAPFSAADNVDAMDTSAAKPAAQATDSVDAKLEASATKIDDVDAMDKSAAGKKNTAGDGASKTDPDGKPRDGGDGSEPPKNPDSTRPQDGESPDTFPYRRTALGVAGAGIAAYWLLKDRQAGMRGGEPSGAGPQGGATEAPPPPVGGPGLGADAADGGMNRQQRLEAILDRVAGRAPGYKPGRDYQTLSNFTY